jgi:hypothetical protein
VDQLPLAPIYAHELTSFLLTEHIGLGNSYYAPLFQVITLEHNWQPLAEWNASKCENMSQIRQKVSLIASFSDPSNLG